MFIFAADLENNMERNLLIELLEDGEKVSLYSPHFEGEEYSEFERFLLTYKDTYPDDVRQLVYRLDIIKRDGARDMYFRFILGNGGLKNTATYEEDENLHRQVKLLQKIDIQLKQRERNKVIVVTGTELLGELSFTIDDE